MCDCCRDAAGSPTEIMNIFNDAVRVIKTLSTHASSKATLLQLLDAWRKADKAGAKEMGRDMQEQVSNC